MPASRASRSPLLSLLLALLVAVLFILFWQSGVKAQDQQQNLGAQLYAQNCSVCHGADGQGRVGATLAKDWPSIRPELTVRAIIANGVPGSPMPAWSKAKGGPFSEQQIDALVEYILSWQTGGAPQIAVLPTATPRPLITPLPDVTGDPNRGAVLFAENCAMCHGEDGQGRIGATLAKAWPSIRPDLSIRATIARGVPGSAMPAWSQANGGPLSENDIDDLTAFIRAIAADSPVIQITPALNLPPRGTSPVLGGWAGVLLFMVLMLAIIAAAFFLQRNTPPAK